MILDLWGYGITDTHKVYDSDGLALYFKVYLTDIEYSDKTDVRRFSSASKLARFAGIAPLTLSSNGKGKDLATKQGNRRLQATIYLLAVQMVQKTSKGQKGIQVFENTMRIN